MLSLKNIICVGFCFLALLNIASCNRDIGEDDKASIMFSVTEAEKIKFLENQETLFRIEAFLLKQKEHYRIITSLCKWENDKEISKEADLMYDYCRELLFLGYQSASKVISHNEVYIENQQYERNSGGAIKGSLLIFIARLGGKIEAEIKSDFENQDDVIYKHESINDSWSITTVWLDVME